MANLFTSVLLGSDSQVQVFVSSLNNIKSYAAWVVAVQDTTDSTLDSILTTAKTDATTWYNTIAPQYLNMPSTVVSKGQTIDNDLQTLISLSNQLKSADSPALREAIKSMAGNLNDTLQAIQTDTLQLATQLTSFGTKTDIDRSRFSDGGAYIQQKLSALSSQLAQQQGQLNSLQHAACPDSSKIQAVEANISSTKSSINQYTNFMGLFNKGINLSNDAYLSSIYLAHYWQGLSDELNNSISQLGNVMQSPAVVIKLQLQVNQQNWDSTKALFQEIDQSIS